MMGASALQSAHQCAQKNSNTGEPAIGQERQCRAQDTDPPSAPEPPFPAKTADSDSSAGGRESKCCHSAQRGLQQRDRLRPLPRGTSTCDSNFQRSAQREWQVRFGVERAVFQQSCA